MISLILSTIAFFVASFAIKRWLDDSGIPKGITRGIVILVGASLVSYAVAYAIDLIA